MLPICQLCVSCDIMIHDKKDMTVVRHILVKKKKRRKIRIKGDCQFISIFSEEKNKIKCI